VKRIAALLTVSMALAALAPTALADAPTPGSVLVFPINRNDPLHMTLISVTNTDSSTSGATNASFRYVSTNPNPANPLKPFSCNVTFRAELLTKADTVTVLTKCHVGNAAKDGYVVVNATNPQGGGPWSHNFLIGSELIIDFGSGAVCSIDAYSFRAMAADGASTEADFDGRLDFNGIEYEATPDDVYLDSFVASANPKLALINMSGDRDALVTTDFYIWNDNEFPLSLTIQFRCWFEVPLATLGNVFSQDFLKNNTPDDSQEVDTDCNNSNDYESGWVRISGNVAVGNFATVTNPPLLGALCGGSGSFDGGRLLWGSFATRNGEF
jgi:hypothetical protein